METKNRIKIIKNMANIALLIGFVSLIFDRIIPGTSFPYILIAFAGSISMVGFILLIIWVEPIRKKNNDMNT